MNKNDENFAVILKSLNLYKEKLFSEKDETF